MTLTEVATATGLTRAAARRFLLTLRELGYVASQGRRFRLTPRVLELGYAFLSSLRLPEIAQPYLENVSRAINESCSICVLDRTEIVYVARCAAERIMSVTLSVGTRLPAHATSMGRVLLAGLPPEELDDYLRGVTLRSFTPKTVTDEVRLRRILAKVSERGYAFVDQELELGLLSIAVPLRNGHGRVSAAVNVSAHAGRITRVHMEKEYLPHLREAASEIERSLTA